MHALLMDYGGVMTTSVVDSFGAFCAREGIDPERFRSVVIGAARTPGSIFARVETGELSAAAFDEALAALLLEGCGVRVDAAGLKTRLFAGVEPDQAMIEAVRAARAAGIRTALVSNSWGGDDYPMDLLGTLFDEVIISGKVGLRKPDAAIYRLAAERVGAATEACVFVDDFRINVEGAEAVGMQGVLHRSSAQTVPQLGMLLGVGMP